MRLIQKPAKYDQKMIEYDPTENDTIKTTLTLLDRLLDQNENLIRKRCGLDRDDVVRLTARMKRENFLPTQIGVEAVIEFLEAGFYDCGPSDYCRWGVNARTLIPAAEEHPKLVVEVRETMNQWGNRSEQHFINLANRTKPDQVAKHAKGERQKDRGAGHDQSRGRGATTPSKRRRPQRKQSRYDDYQG